MDRTSHHFPTNNIFRSLARKSSAPVDFSRLLGHSKKSVPVREKA
jgi:hypothetical protein